jgi:putative addiction module killer protein
MSKPHFQKLFLILSKSLIAKQKNTLLTSCSLHATISSVQATEKKVLTYVTQSGFCPFDEWLGDLRDNRAVAQIQRRLSRVQLGNFGDAKSVGSGVLELRIDVGPGYRVYFAQEGAEIVILLCGGDKSSQSKDIQLAHEYWADCKKRRKEDEER